MPMTQRAAWVGVSATAAILLVLTLAAVREPSRLDDAQAAQRAAALDRAMDLYAFNCAECHGSRGQGEIQEDATTLNDDYMRGQETDFLYEAIERGRDDTEMAAFHIDEGGALNRQQIESLVTLIQYGDWDDTGQRVAALGMVTDEELALAETEALREALAELPMIMVVPTTVPVEGAAVAGEPAPATAPPVVEVVPTTAPADTLPAIEIVPTETPADALPAIEIVPTDAQSDALPAIEIVPTAAPADMLPAIEIVPTAAPADALPAIEIVPTETPADALPAIEIVPTESSDDAAADRAALSLYAMHCAECHGAHGEGVDDMPGLDTEAVRAQSARELGRVSFDNVEIEGHDAFLTPDEKVSLIDLMLSGFPQGD